MIKRNIELLRRFRFFITILCLVISSVARAAGEIEANKWLGKDRSKTFEELVTQLQQFEIPSLRGMNRIHTTWEKELAKTKLRFMEAKSKEDVYYALLSLKNSMHDYHSKPLIDPGVKPADGRAQLPIKLRPVFRDGAVQYIVEISNEKLIKPGYILKNLDGKTPREWEVFFLEWVNSTSPEYINLLVSKWLTERDSDRLPIPLLGSPALLTFFDPKTQTEIKVELKWITSDIKPSPEGCLNGEFSSDYANYKPQFQGLNFCVFTNVKGYFVIKYFSFFYDFSDNIPRLWNKFPEMSFKPKHFSSGRSAGSEIAAQDQEQIRKLLLKHNPEKVLFDVRENYGGDVFPSFISLFTKKPFSLLKRQVIFSTYMKDHADFLKESLNIGDKEMLPLAFQDQEQGDKTSRLFPFFCLSKECEPEEALIPPNPFSKNNFKVFVLTGPRCVSSCDQFVAIMKDNGIAKIVGLPTNGGHSPYRAFLPMRLKNDSIFKIKITTGEGYRPNGEPTEGNPVSPDIRIEFQDDYLTKAIKALNKEINL